MPEVTGTPTLPAGGTLAGRVRFQLVGAGGVALAQAWNTATDEIVVGSSEVDLDGAGAYAITVAANADLEPAGTVWARTVIASGVTGATAYLAVDDLGGDERRMLADPPGEIASAALTEHAATTLDADAHGGAALVSAVAALEVDLGAHETGLLDDGVHGVVVHDWDRDGWAPFTRQPVNPHGAATVTETVADSRGRLTGQANSTDGNRRDWWLRYGTEWENSEIRSLWWGPSVMDGAIAVPQLGHAHRVVEVAPGVWRAYVVTNNIFGSIGEAINLNVWETDGATLTLGSNGGSGVFSGSLERTLAVTAVRRQNLFLWFADLFVSNAHMLAGVRAGDVMTSDVSDGTFDFADIAVDAVGSGAGFLRFRDPVSSTPVDPTPAAGTITPEPHRRYFPYWLASQLVDTVLRVKVWPVAQAEPDWGDTQRVVSFDTAGANDPAPDVAAAPTGPGFCGLVSAHLRSSAYLEFGEVAFRRL